MELAFLRDQLAQSSPAALTRVDSIVALVDRTMQSVRKIATELRPVVLDQLGPIPAIEWQAGEFQARTGIQCTLNIYLRTVALPIDRSTGVFRIFQEILTNVARHARASRVDISMHQISRPAWPARARAAAGRRNKDRTKLESGDDGHSPYSPGSIRTRAGGVARHGGDWLDTEERYLRIVE
jgi:hypothetical protein